MFHRHTDKQKDGHQLSNMPCYLWKRRGWMHCDVYSTLFYVFVGKNVLNISKIYCKSKTDNIKIHHFKDEIVKQNAIKKETNSAFGDRTSVAWAQDYADSCFRTLEPKKSKMHRSIIKQISYSKVLRAFLSNKNIKKN